MKLPHFLLRRLSWLNLPLGLLLVFLQRTPAVRVFSALGDYAVASPVGQLLRASATLATLGAMHSRAGATEFIGPSGVVTGTVGTPISSVAFTYVGTPSSPVRFEFIGSLPPGLDFSPAPSGNNIPSGTPAIVGTPTVAGSYVVEVKGFQSEDISNDIFQPIEFLITGGATTTPAISAQPASQSAPAGQNVTLSVTASNATGFQWTQNGTVLGTATSASLTLGSLQPANAGLYRATVTGSAGTATSQPAIVGVSTSQKVIGNGFELAGNISHPNGNIFDQILMDGAAVSFTADAEQATRMSYIDMNDDIVQIEFAGPGTLSVVMDTPGTPAPPVKYNQPSVSYMKGHAGIVITGATENTHVSVFTVGRATAFDPTGGYNILLAPSDTNNPANNGSSLFAGHAGTNYDGAADIAFIAIASSDGRFGGIRTANTTYMATKGITGIYAPNVQFTGPVFVSDITAFDDATPMLITGSASNSRITGGNLQQANGRAVQVKGFAQLVFAAGSDSHGNITTGQANQAVLEQDGVNVTSQIVVNP